ncbi:unnamed protein product, partial [Prorocentrum cordatum]
QAGLQAQARDTGGGHNARRPRDRRRQDRRLLGGDARQEEVERRAALQSIPRQAPEWGPETALHGPDAASARAQRGEPAPADVEAPAHGHERPSGARGQARLHAAARLNARASARGWRAAPACGPPFAGGAPPEGAERRMGGDAEE